MGRGPRLPRRRDRNTLAEAEEFERKVAFWPAARTRRFVIVLDRTAAAAAEEEGGVATSYIEGGTKTIEGTEFARAESFADTGGGLY